MSLRTPFKSFLFSFIKTILFSISALKRAVFIVYAPILSAQEETRASGFEQKQRHAHQQIRMHGRVLQRNGEVLLQAADAVKYGIAVGIEGVTGLFQRVAAGEIVVERFTV